MRYRVLMTTTCAAAIAAGLLGCRSNDPKAPASAGQDMLSIDAYPKITVDPPLNKYIVTHGPIVDSSREIMRVVVPIRATTNSVEPNVQYRFLFYDANGIELRQQTGWRMVQLPVRTEVQLAGNALDNTAADWRLEIRPGR